MTSGPAGESDGEAALVRSSLVGPSSEFSGTVGGACASLAGDESGPSDAAEDICLRDEGLAMLRPAVGRHGRDLELRIGCGSVDFLSSS